MEPPEGTLSDHFPASLGDLVKQLDLVLNFFRRLTSDHSAGGISLQLHALIFWSTIATIFTLACLHVKFKKKKNNNKFKKSEFGSLRPTVNDHAFLGGNKEDIAKDAKFAEELQVQEALLASITASQVANSASSSVQSSDMMNSDMLKIDQEVSSTPQSFCEICFENRERWQMFTNDSCSHTFCHDCTSKHIVAKIQENVKTVTCPGVNCNATLDFDVCRLLIPLDAVVQWDELLCKSLIPDSQKLYCPFHDCSTLLIDDSGVVIKKIKCPMCKRSFCARCRVPWHSEFTCKEFQILNEKKGQKEELMVKSLAKKKNWRKCSHCKMYVEKSEGCSHMTCRCGHEFCYRCGANWSGCLGGCREKS